MTTLWLDTEDYSTVPLANGHHAYAEESEVLLVSYAWDDEPKAYVVDITQRPEFLSDLQGMVDRADEVGIHNSAFDRTVLRHHGIQIPVEKITDTMVMALEHSLPGALDKLCELLQVPYDLAKAKDGKKLIHLFCKPLGKNRKLRRATRETHPKEWADFIEYARLDVIAMREVKKRLPRWNWTPTEIALWRLDQTINDRGFAVDRELATAALRAAERTSARLAAVIDGLTSGAVSSVMQRQRTLDYVVDTLGYRIPDLKAATLEGALADPDLPPDVRDVLECRAEGAATSPSKYSALLRATSPDGRLRGTIQFCGASRTGRDAGRVFQPQNLPRPKLKKDQIELGIRAMKLDVEDLIFDNVMELCSSAIRGSIIAPPGRKLVIADLSNIEGRMVAWLAGEESKLAKFKAYDAGTGPDIYKATAADILGKHHADITEDERQGQGKVPELACGFGGAVGAFTTMAANYGVHFPEDRVVEIVKAWRKQHPNIVRLWYGSEKAAIAAVQNPGKVYETGKLRFRYTPNEIMPMLLMKLPSGRFLCYPHAEVDDYGSQARLLYQGMNQYTHQWGVIDTWGGKLVENPTQAAARDIFYHGARQAEAAGYEIVGRVHDELIAETPDSAEFTAEGLAAIMASGPLWSVGLPLAAAGFETYRYAKQ